MPVKLAPSILSCDFTRLGEELRAVSTADYIHVDVMDGLFVPNISFGFPILSATRRALDAGAALGLPRPFIDVHLMVERPERYLAEFADAGADGITVHLEATPHIHRAAQLVRALGKKVGVAINPGTPLEALRPVLPDLDLVLVMSVNPGFGGQQFIPATYQRVQVVRAWLDELGSRAEVQVDGGVAPQNALALARSGASVLVAGSSVFGASGAAAGLEQLRGALQEAAAV